MDAGELGAALRSTLSSSPGFWSYLRENLKHHKWVIGSDYVIKNKEKPWDTMAFTIYPVVDGPHFIRLLTQINSEIPKDVKDIQTIKDPTITLMRSPHYFSVVVMLDKERRKIISDSIIKKMIEHTVDIAEKWENKNECSSTIRAIRALRDETKRRTFNGSLMLNISYASAIAAILSYYLTTICGAEVITWISDRDAISEAYNKVYGTFFSVGHSNICQEMNGFPPKTKLFLVCDNVAQSGSKAWFDPAIRLPDYLCGAISAMKEQGNRLEPVRAKYAQLLDKVIADNKNIIICKIRVKNVPIMKFPAIECLKVHISSMPTGDLSGT